MRINQYSKIIVFVFIGILLSFANNSFGQSNDHAGEKLEADALALAYVTCDQSLTKHYFELDRENIELQNNLIETGLLKDRMTVGFNKRYESEDLKKKFDREFSSATKKLNKCIKYQNILDATAEEEKEKAKLNK